VRAGVSARTAPGSRARKVSEMTLRMEGPLVGVSRFRGRVSDLLTLLRVPPARPVFQ